MRVEQIIKDATNKVIENAVFQDWKHWYLQDFESDIPICSEEDLKECTEEEIEESKADFIYDVVDGFVGGVCELLKIGTECGRNKYHDELLEEICDIVKEELRRQF